MYKNVNIVSIIFCMLVCAVNSNINITAEKMDLKDMFYL